MKLLRLTMLLIAILLCSIASAQSIEPAGNGFFLIDRAFAEQAAARFDSLTACKVLYAQSEEALSACKQTVSDAGQSINLQSKSIMLLKQEKEMMQNIIDTKNNMIQIIESNHQITTEALKKSNRRLKRQKFFGIAGGILVGFVTGVTVAVLAQ